GDGGDGRALEGRQQHAAQRIAQGQTEAALQRFGDDGGDTAGVMTGFGLELVRLDQFLPVLLKHIFSSSCPGHVGPWPYVRRVSLTSDFSLVAPALADAPILSLRLAPSLL